MSAERWLPVVGWESRYEVSDRGRLRSITGQRRVLRTQIVRVGYAGYNLSDGRARRQMVPLHVLVMAAFVGPRPDGMQIRHIDGDKQNNRVENLAYGTAEENWEDRRRLGEYVESTTCPYGHAFDAENAYHRPPSSRGRACRKCHARRNREYRARQRALAAGSEVAA